MQLTFKNATTLKILVIRFSSIGDIVLTTPVLRAIKQQIAGAELHYLTKKKYSVVLEHNQRIDKLHLLDNNFAELMHQLRSENFDYVIDLHKNLRTTRVKMALRVKSFAFDKINVAKWLMVNLKKNRMPQKHIVDRYMATLNHFNVEPDNQGLEHPIHFRQEVNLLSLPKEFTFGYIAFAIGAQFATKRLPTTKIIEICRGTHLPVILLGGQEDADRATEIQAAVGASKVMNACGKYSLNQSASVVRQARIVITHDTGLMHIAAAYHKKIISVWGNTIPEFGMYPYQPNSETAIVQVENLSCRPCSKIGFAKCPKKHFKCMNDIDIDKIVMLANFWSLSIEKQQTILNYGKN